MQYSPTRLRDYALWYYFRYYPSNARLLQKLIEKGTQEDADTIYKDISHLLKEDEIISSKIDNYIFRNKNYRYIRTKMYQKLFPKEKIELYLGKYLESGESLLDTDYLNRKIDTYARKGKSKKYIFLQLSETSEDRELLEQLLNQYFIEGESENIMKQYDKLSHKYKRDKIVQKLLEK